MSGRASDVSCTRGTESHNVALVFASGNGDALEVELRLSQGADPNADDQLNGDRLSALYYAAKQGHAQCLTLLLGAGAAVDQPTNKNATPLYFAAEQGHEQCLTQLLGAGAKVDYPNQSGFAPLHIAAKNGQQQCLKLLLSAGAKVDKPTKRGATPLHIAALYGHEQCVTQLLGAAAKVDQPNQSGFTSLHIAARQGHDQCLTQLLNSGADPSIQTNSDIGKYSNMTALDIALKKDHATIASLLRLAAKRSPQNEQAKEASTAPAEVPEMQLCRQRVADDDEEDDERVNTSERRSLARVQTEEEKIRLLTTYLSDVVGITNGATDYARGLVEQEFDSVKMFEQLSLEELQEDFGFKKAHLIKVKLHRDTASQAAEGAPVGPQLPDGSRLSLTEKIIGRGASGIVREATLTRRSGATEPVATKTLAGGSSEREIQSFVKEYDLSLAAAQ